MNKNKKILLSILLSMMLGSLVITKKLEANNSDYTIETYEDDSEATWNKAASLGVNMFMQHTPLIEGEYQKDERIENVFKRLDILKPLNSVAVRKIVQEYIKIVDEFAGSPIDEKTIEYFLTRGSSEMNSDFGLSMKYNDLYYQFSFDEISTKENYRYKMMQTLENDYTRFTANRNTILLENDYDAYHYANTDFYIFGNQEDDEVFMGIVVANNMYTFEAYNHDKKIIVNIDGDNAYKLINIMIESVKTKESYNDFIEENNKLLRELFGEEYDSFIEGTISSKTITMSRF